jgi:Rrf2 family protein
MLTNKAKYGIKALISLGKQYGKESLLISEISDGQNIPKKFLEVILLELKNDGYLQSKTGKSGGYKLIRKPDNIILGDVIRLFDGPLAPVRCASITEYLPCEDCIDVKHCKVRRLMKEVRDAISGVLDEKTLADIL